MANLKTFLNIHMFMGYASCVYRRFFPNLCLNSSQNVHFSFFNGVSPESDKPDTEVDLANTTIPSIPYHQMSISPNSNLVIAGTLEQEAFRFCARMQALGSNCEAVTLPMTSPTDRANVVTSASVLLFEARRQILALQAT